MYLEVSLALLAFVFLTVLFQSTLNLLGSSIHPLATAAAAAIPLLAFIITYGWRRPSQTGLSILAYLAIICLCAAVAGLVADDSWDGNSYHKVAVGAIAHGWNPMSNYADSDFAQLFGHDNIWVNSYPKGVWIFSASIYQLTGNIECGKSAALIVAVSLLLFAYWFLGAKVKKKLAFLLALLLAFNPVTISQLGTFYIDGILGNLIIMLLLALSHIVRSTQQATSGPQQFWQVLLVVAIAACMAVNTKFTGIAFVAIVGAVYLLYFVAALIRKRKSGQLKEGTAVFCKVLVCGLLSLSVGIGILGANTYAKNIINDHHILHPLMGEGAVDIVTNQSPRGFENRGSLYKFIRSNLGKSENIAYKDDQYNAGLKVPFTVTKSETEAFAEVDVRIAGYGPLFGGILLLALALGLAVVVRQIRNRRADWDIWLPVSAVVLTVLVVPEMWWARYFPQLYLLPLLCTAYLFEDKWKNWPYVLCVLMILNSFIVGVFRLSAVATHYETDRQALGRYSNSANIELYFDDFHTYYGEYFNIRDSFPDAAITLVSKDEYESSPDSFEVTLREVWVRAHDN